jgi:HAD superfamily hydrolase (TIGR01509 family)
MGASLLDIDGTLVDTNYQHALAWYRAFCDCGVTLPVWRIHRHIGMGGDQLVGALCGEDFDREKGDAVRDAETAHYATMIGDVRPMEGARELVVDLHDAGQTVVLASSAKPEEVDHYLGLLDARELADAWTTSGDVSATKPAPDLVKAALERAGCPADEAVLIGDSPWDVEAAKRAGVTTVAVMTGGFAREELLSAGAVAVFDSVGELRTSFGRTLLAGTPA